MPLQMPQGGVREGFQMENEIRAKAKQAVEAPRRSLMAVEGPKRLPGGDAQAEKRKEVF